MRDGGNIVACIQCDERGRKLTSHLVELIFGDVLPETFMRVLHLLVLASALLVAPAFGIEYKPYPTARITPAQWESYYTEVRAAHGASMQEAREQRLVVFHDRVGILSYSFTQPGHAAHPAWITRKMWEKDGTWWLDQIGYFAGEEAPFAELFRQYQELNKRMIEDLNRRRAK